jgi:hypothetical protein
MTVKGRSGVAKQTATRARRAIVACLASLLLVVNLGSPPVSIAATTSDDFLRFDSVDDYIGQGVSTELTDADASFGLQDGVFDGSFTATVATDDDFWTLRFIAPVGESLQVGHYANVNRFPSTTGGLDISHHGSGCNQTSGSFTIQQLDLDESGHAVAFAATFVHWCDLNFSPLSGMIRVNSIAPQAALSSPHASRAFGNVTVGETSDTRTFTVEAIGDLSVEVDAVSVIGPAAGDFPISSNGCVDVTLDAGETCSFDATFVPSAIQGRSASFVIGNDADEGDRVLPIGGWGRTPTTTSVRVEPDWVYFQPGLRLIVEVAPDADHAVECIYDGSVMATGSSSVVATSAAITPTSATTLCVHARELGTAARFPGGNNYGASESSVLTFEVSSETSVDLGLSRTSVPAGVPMTISASVRTASDLLYPGGTITFRDVTTNRVIATRSIDFGSSNPSVVASFTAGSHQIKAEYSGVDGILDASSDTATLTVLADNVAPSATNPKLAPRTGASQTFGGHLPVRLSWTGSDNLSGIARYQVARQFDGGAWSSPWTVTTPNSYLLVAPWHDYRFRVRPIDYAGNVGAWRYGNTVRFRRFEDDSAKVKYSISWHTTVDGPWWDGVAQQSWKSGSWARFTITGRSFAWIGLRAPDRGRAAIYVNGAYVTTVDLYAASQQPWAIAWSKTWAISATRTIEIRVLGTPGRPKIEVDGFWVGT